jgi:hypothetical protein
LKTKKKEEEEEEEEEERVFLGQILRFIDRCNDQIFCLFSQEEFCKKIKSQARVKIDFSSSHPQRKEIEIKEILM